MFKLFKTFESSSKIEIDKKITQALSLSEKVTSTLCKLKDVWGEETRASMSIGKSFIKKVDWGISAVLDVCFQKSNFQVYFCICNVDLSENWDYFFPPNHLNIDTFAQDQQYFYWWNNIPRSFFIAVWFQHVRENNLPNAWAELLDFQKQRDFTIQKHTFTQLFAHFNKFFLLVLSIKNGGECQNFASFRHQLLYANCQKLHRIKKSSVVFNDIGNVIA